MLISDQVNSQESEQQTHFNISIYHSRSWSTNKL